MTLIMEKEVPRWWLKRLETYKWSFRKRGRNERK